MPAPAPTFGNAAGDDLDMPEVGTTAGLSVTMFLHEPFHTQVKSVIGDGYLFLILTVLAWFESVSLVSQNAEYLFSLGYFCCENVHAV